MMKTIRILHVFGTLNRGGAETRTMEIYRSINREKFQFDFVKHTEKVCDFDQEIKDLGGRIFTIPRFRGTNIIEYKKAWEKLFTKSKDIRIVHANMLTTAFIYFPIAQKNGITKIIAHSRSASEDRFDKRLLAKLSRLYATDFIAVSKKASLNAFGTKATKSKVKIINDTIDSTKYIFNLDYRNQIRKEFGLGDKKIYGHVGRLHLSKNHKFLLKLFKKILVSEPEAILILVGDGPLKNKIKILINDLKIENNVIMCGLRPDVEKFYSTFDILLFPSLFEGYPGVIFEAQTSGLPILMSNRITSEVIASELVNKASIKSTNRWLEILAQMKINLERFNYELSYKVKKLENTISFFENYYDLGVKM